MNNEELLTFARHAMQMSYSPYSNCKVGAALLAKNGKVYEGCNIENAAYGPTMCAERTAIFKAVSEGVTEFEKIAIVGGKNGVEDGLYPPCGVCRQVMREFCSLDFPVILGKKDGFVETTLEELLPYSFGPENLN
ncbi:MAG: cytidine deaminase [Lachnospiraceae bacterium]|jgi:cytidine deaminase|nr:cytidine deaminase [Lachnospiraceae bacterium]